MKQWQEITDQFEVQSEDGQRFQVNVYTTMTANRTTNNPNAAPISGMKEARTSEGHHLNRVDDNNWIIVELNLPVMRV